MYGLVVRQARHLLNRSCEGLLVLGTVEGQGTRQPVRL